MNITNKKLISFLSAIIVLSSIAIYLPTLSSGFLWDDLQLVTHPLHIGNNPYAFFFGGEVYYRPLVHLSMNLDYNIWHLNPVGYHITNITLHSANALMVFFLCLYLLMNGFSDFKKSSPQASNTNHIITTSFIAALFFALHPIHSESVAWISGRTDLLATFFFLLAFISFLSYEKEGRSISLFLSSFFFSAHFSAKKMHLNI